MKKVRYSLLVVAIAAVASVVIGAQKRETAETSTASVADHHKVFDPANLKWGDPPPGLPSGAHLAVLSGDQGKKGSLHCSSARARRL